MKTRNVPIALILAATAALIFLSDRAGGQVQTNTEADQPIAGGMQRPIGSGGMGTLQAQLLSLTRTEFATPEARIQAIRQWQTANASALKAEIDARREIQRPEQERLRAATLERLDQALTDQVAAGKTGTLQAKFIRVSRSQFDSPEQRVTAIRQWQAQNGAALKAETDNRRAIEAPARAARQAETSALQQQKMQAAVASGLIGPLQAELVQINRNPDLAPAAKQQAVQNWMTAHGTQLSAEIAARRTAQPVTPVRPAAPVDPPAP